MDVLLYSFWIQLCVVIDTISWGPRASNRHFSRLVSFSPPFESDLIRWLLVAVSFHAPGDCRLRQCWLSLLWENSVVERFYWQMCRVVTNSSFVCECSCLYGRIGNRVQHTSKWLKLILNWDIPLCWVNQ
jgi:hypothetical protein